MLSRWINRSPLPIGRSTRPLPSLRPPISSFRPHSTFLPPSTPTQQDEGSEKVQKGSTSSTLSGNRLKTLMIDHLSHSRPRQALDLFLSHLSHPHQSHSGRTLEGLVWIFFQYRQPRLALESIERLHEKGSQVSTRLGAKLLRSFGNEIMFDQGGQLIKVLRWIKEGIARDQETGIEIDENMIETVMDVLKKMGRTEWSHQVFQAYRETLEGVGGKRKPGNPRLWASAISAQAAGGDILAAQLLFKDWRTTYFESTPTGETPPEAPYLALLNHFAVNSPPLPVSKDPAYLLLQLVKADRLPATTSFLNALLRTELSRRRYSSFWGIWNLFDEPQVIDSGITRDHSSWKLASRAKLVSDESRRQRGRLHHSPLLNLSPIPYTEAHTPSSRSLFSRLLSTRLQVTSNRPSLRLSTSKPDPFSATPSSSRLPSPSDQQASTNLLNSFLNLFLSYRDFPAALIVLETFHVHRISPNSTTHSIVVLSIIKLWEKGKLATRSGTGRGREGGDELFGSGTLGGIEGRETRRKSRVQRNIQGEMAIEAIKEILEKRNYRVGLWQRRRGREPSTSVQNEPGGGGIDSETATEGETEETGIEDVREEPPQWMLQREMRDTSYLIELFEKCSGLDKQEWDAILEQTRKELLPAPSTDRVKERKRKITKGARFRNERFGKEL
ncbi:uncharacterized protein JCM6883_004888 [Sporobolomyces salmoneus]|uniref:uncharacterized protein n=1 Tax=Sporobolomyces salmoneus TaxID=183962 RepID=UPI00318204FD